MKCRKKQQQGEKKREKKKINAWLVISVRQIIYDPMR